jgi:hypothetical protein
MSYGQNLPWGMQAVRSLTSASYNSQGNQYIISPNATNSIFRGDLVRIDADGYVTSIYDVGGGFTTTASVGVFNGCSYVTPTANNPIDPASPGRPFWPVGTVLAPNTQATAFVLDDPNIIYNIQTNSANGLTQTNIGQVAAVSFQTANNLVIGNTNTGVSLMSLDQATAAVGNPTLNLKILRLIPNPDGSTNIGYNNAEVIIQNHFYCSRPGGV